MSVKSLVQSLFKLSGSQAFPSSQYQSFTTSVNHNWGEQHVAPSDGYVCVWGANVSSVEIGNISRGFSVRSQSTSSAGAMLPARKGETFHASISWTGDTAPTYRFYKSVGST